MNGKLLNEKYTFFTLGAEKTYTVEKGNLISYKVNKALEENIFGTTLFKNVETIDDLINLVEKTKENEQRIAEDNIDYSQHVSTNECDMDEETIIELIEENVNEIFLNLETLIEDIESLGPKTEKTSKQVENLKVVKDFLITISSNE
jgi:aconitase B